MDNCPAQSAFNYCKVGLVPSNQRCGDPMTNSLDVSVDAYGDLVADVEGRGGEKWWEGSPNLNILIEEVECL